MLTNNQVITLIELKNRVRDEYDKELEQFTRKTGDFPFADSEITYIANRSFMTVLKCDSVDVSISEVENYFSIIDRQG